MYQFASRVAEQNFIQFCLPFPVYSAALPPPWGGEAWQTTGLLLQPHIPFATGAVRMRCDHLTQRQLVTRCELAGSSLETVPRES